MAWRSTGKSNAELFENLSRAGIIKSPRVVAAFKSVDRVDYVVNARDAWEDAPQYLQDGATISAPHMHAHAVENLEPLLQPGATVLDVGCGSGYLLGVFHHLVAPGRVLGIDHLPSLTALSLSNLARQPSSPAARALNSSPPAIKVICADGRKGSPPEETPEGGWTCIHVGAAAPVMPEELVRQLAKPGRMFVPVGIANQAIWQVDKDAQGTVTKKRLFGVSYVPLTDAES